ncbi:MAG: aminopeptidase N, partial [Propionibacteriaceae bacterium]|nr:aminopeptidase N [Propionibacteriaceae bacterium]
MYPANITRAESQERGLLVQTHQYQVLLDLSGRRIGGIDPERQFLSTTAIRFEQLAPARTFVNLIADEVISANIDGTNLDSRDFHDDKVFFEVGPGTHDLVVSAVCRYSRTGEGLHRFTDPVDGEPYLYSQFEPADARRVFACFEQPDLKARWQFSVIVPEGWTVISNSPQVWPQRVEDGVNRFDSPFTEPISSYLAAIVAGRYHIEKDVYHGIVDVPLTLACRQSMRPYLDSERLFEITKRGFAVFEEAFGRRYPFKDYAQVFVPEYNFGAMENAGCVTYRDEYLFRYRVPHHTLEDRDNTVLHEMAHMWFGDLVTMKWWDDLWLNESFAEWASHFNQQRIREKVLAGQWEPLGPVPDDPWATFANNRKNWAYRQDQLPTTHPIAADMVDLEAIEQNFDGITYAKGASTLKQLV